MSYGDITDVKQALSNLIAGPHFIAALQDAVLTKRDGVMPPTSLVSFPYESLSLTRYPVCQVIGLRTAYPEADMVKHALHEVAIMWTAVAPTEEIVTKHVELLVRATVDLVWGVSLDMAVANGPLLVTAEDYSPLVPARDHPFLKSGRVMVTIPTWRD